MEMMHLHFKPLKKYKMVKKRKYFDFRHFQSPKFSLIYYSHCFFGVFKIIIALLSVRDAAMVVKFHLFNLVAITNVRFSNYSCSDIHT